MTNPSYAQLVGTLRVVAGLIHDALPSAQGSAAEVLAHAYEAIETTLVGVPVEPTADAKDAARYRCVRTEKAGDRLVRNGELLVGDQLDEEIDKLLNAQRT